MNTPLIRTHASRLASLLALATGTSAAAEVSLPCVFTDHAVIQAERPIPVWGRATPGSEIVVSLGSSAINAITTPEGTWRVTLPPMATSFDPQVLHIEGDGSSIDIKDVLIGEVWICGGQSNMEWVVDHSKGANVEKARVRDASIRLIKAPHLISPDEEFTMNASWQVGTPEVVGNWSAVGLAFGQAITESRHTPVGLISSNWGGTRIEPWMDEASLLACPVTAEAMMALRTDIEARRGTPQPSAATARDIEITYWNQLAAIDPGFREGWMRGGAATAEGWNHSLVPGHWGSDGRAPELRDFDGIVWYSRKVTLPPDWAESTIVLRLGAIDDSDTVWVNGQQVGQTTMRHDLPRVYEVPPGTFKGGDDNWITVAVVDPHADGGFASADAALSLHPRGVTRDAVSLAGDWMYRVGAGTRLTPSNPNAPWHGLNQGSPGSLWNAMMAPFAPYAVKGAIWYQGESNAGEPTEYAALLPALIRSWSRRFESPDFAFGIVQLAAFKEPSDNPDQGGWAWLRAAQDHAARTVPDAFQVVTTDLGEANDIHPKDKRTVGDRLASSARVVAYGERVPCALTPIATTAWQGARVDGHIAVAVSCDNASQLTTRDGAGPGGFAVAGADGVFHWASAELNGNSVLVWSDLVAQPTTVIYAWQDNPVRANVVNECGLPLAPFRFQVR
ncbi:MAG: beta galactosidase jelly roll domain-containing protein [Planctomycetota bacterium]|nr:beta galactosidase jelly roll domain-containing protein [Planctomycetota bacterium]